MFSSFGPIWIDISLLLAALLKLEITVSFLWLSLPVHSGSLKRIKYSKLYSLAHTLLSNVFSALKGTHFYILFVVYFMALFVFLLRILANDYLTFVTPILMHL